MPFTVLAANGSSQEVIDSLNKISTQPSQLPEMLLAPSVKLPEPVVPVPSIQTQPRQLSESKNRPQRSRVNALNTAQRERAQRAAQARISALEQQLAAAKNALAEKNNNGDLTSQTNKNNSEIKALKEQLTASEVRSQLLDKQIMLLSALKPKAGEDLQSVQTKLADSAKKEQQFNEQIKALTVARDRALESQKRAEQAAAQAQHQVEEQQAQLAKSGGDKAEIARLNQAQADSAKKEQQFNEQIKALTVARDRALEAQKRAEQAAAQAQHQVEEQQAQLAKSGGDKAEIARLNQAQADSAKKEQQFNEQVKTLTAARDRALEAQKHAEQAAAQTQHQMEEQQAQLAKSGGDKAEIARLNQAQADSAKKEQQLNDQIKALTAARDAAEALKTQSESKSAQRLAQLQKQYDETVDALKVARLQEQANRATDNAQSLHNEQLNADIKRRDDELKQMRQQVQALQKDKESLTAKVGDLDTRLQAEQKLRTEPVKHTGDESPSAVALTARQKNLDEQAARIKQLTEEVAAARITNTALQQQVDDYAMRSKSQNESLTKANADHEISAPVRLKTENEIRDYAVGVLWGRDILTQLNRQQSNGVDISQQQALYGVNDMVNNQLKLSQEKLVEVLKKTDKQIKEVEAKKTASMSKVERQGAEYQLKFSKKPGVKRSNLGYDYLITKKGFGKINDSDVVAVSIRETIAGGKVLKDMRKLGKVIALRLDMFPPLIRSAIQLASNQGEITIVLPPEMAYGEKGSPPDIPPQATMVYDLEVVGVKNKS